LALIPPLPFPADPTKCVVVATTLLIKIGGIVVSRGYSQLIPASGSTR
jgi:hypothetical protein